MAKFFPVLILLMLALTGQGYARDFTADDFDPAVGDDPERIEMYQNAVGDLVHELTVTATDADGAELFRILPFTMELVGLMTQAQIHTMNIVDPVDMEEIIAEANSNKPAANSFAIMIDGNPEWVGMPIDMYYFPDVEDSDGVQVPLFELDDPLENEDGTMVRQFAVVFESADELRNFMNAPKVVILVGWGEPDVVPLLMDCGFWRQYSIFDTRMDEETPQE